MSKQKTMNNSGRHKSGNVPEKTRCCACVRPDLSKVTRKFIDAIYIKGVRI